MITELIELEVKDEINDEEFIHASNELETKFHMNLDGYIDSELFKGNDNIWRFIMHWESMEHFKAASKLITTSEQSAPFMNCIKGAKIKTYEQIKAWKK